MTELQREYNANLARMKKAEKFMDSSATHEDKDKWIDEFRNINKRLSNLITEIGNMSSDEIQEGFKE